jgi:NhaP-type Na+/H+ or K+/H+ antiporter
MHEQMTILVIALVALGYGYFSRLFSRYYISGPMIFTLVGILLSPLFFGKEVTSLNSDTVQIIAEIALIVVLFSDAAALNLEKLKHTWQLPSRLLLIGLPLTILFSTFVAKGFFPDESIQYLFLLALILAPTDAALGKAVVSDKHIPLTIRSTINVESGLNDGIVYPVIMTLVAIMLSTVPGAKEGDGWFFYVVQQVVFGAVFGAAVGYFGAKIATLSIAKNWMEDNYQNLIPVAVAIVSFYLSEHFGGNGFIAAFFSGLFLGNYSKDLHDNVEEFAESEGELLVMISFVVFGIAFIPATIVYWDLSVLIYALLSLTVLRMLPVAISLIGKEDLSTMLFLGWFGPRGIASILYMLIVVHKLGSIEGHEKIFSVMTLTILLSILLHGLSAKPFAKLYARKKQEENI